MGASDAASARVSSESAAPSGARPGARAAHGVVALLAGLGFFLVLALSGLGWYEVAAPVGHTYGLHPDGLAGAWSRMSDTVSYFTEWSNVVVAVAFGLLWRDPGKAGFGRRVLLADALLMITVTAIVYAVLLAPTTKVTGWSVFTNPLQHIAVPAVAVVVWLVWGPRGWFSGRVIAASLVLPCLWIAWMLLRGAVVGSYPYAFIDPITHGWAAVSQTLGMILVFGLVVALVYGGIDRLFTRRHPRP